MAHYLDINTAIFTLWEYRMSYIEFFGTVANLWCVWLAARNKIATWPVGLVGVVLYIFLFYQIQLYSDLAEQFYFFATSFYGWWLWAQRSPLGGNGSSSLPVRNTAMRTNAISLGIVAAGTVAMGYVMGHIHIWLPQFFPEAASFAYLDAFTTVMSFVATVLMARRFVESWYLWILVDIIGIGLYYAKGVKFISLEYAVFLVIATKGLLEWRKMPARSRDISAADSAASKVGHTMYAEGI